MPLSNWTVSSTDHGAGPGLLACHSAAFTFIKKKKKQIKSKIPPTPFEKGGEIKIKVKRPGPEPSLVLEAVLWFL